MRRALLRPASRSDDVFRAAPRRAGPHRLLAHVDVLAVVAVGGAVGSLARFAVERALPAHAHGFPWGTFVVNVTGCFLLGLLMVFVSEVWRPSRYLRPFLGVGVLGGYTTFSTVTGEVRGLGGAGAWLLANSYLLDSVVGGLAAVWLGVIVARLLARRPVRRNGAQR
ncbi:MAG: fluoride efflux transporter CrcB [Streptosporangiales bacterium]|nr:fluoride efflux transporter CrcB [Streptosporangiales bacterium]